MSNCLVGDRVTILWWRLVLQWNLYKTVTCGCDKRRLCSGTHSKDSQPNCLLFLGKDGSVGFCEVTSAMLNCAAGWPRNSVHVPLLWVPSLHREAPESLPIAKYLSTLLTTVNSCSLFCLYYIEWLFNVIQGDHYYRLILHPNEYIFIRDFPY